MASKILSARQRISVLAVVLLPAIAVAGFVLRPAVATPILVVASIGLAVAVEYLARSVHLERTAEKPRQVIAIAVALGVLVVAGVGVLALLAGNAPWNLILLGAVAGGLVGGGVLAAAEFAQERPRTAQGIVVLIVLIMVVAGARGVGHLTGFASAGSQATLAAGAYLGLFVVLGFFGVKEIL